jgi:hypothetical protein
LSSTSLGQGDLLPHAQQSQTQRRSPLSLLSPPFVAPPGVTRVDHRFHVRLYLPGGECKCLGSFRDEVEAALAYDGAAREHGLPTSKLNFPNGPPSKPDNPSGEHMAVLGVARVEDAHHVACFGI